MDPYQVWNVSPLDPHLDTNLQKKTTVVLIVFVYTVLLLCPPPLSLYLLITLKSEHWVVISILVWMIQTQNSKLDLRKALIMQLFFSVWSIPGCLRIRALKLL